MARLLAVGHVTWDLVQGQEVLGGSAAYASLAARRLGWAAGALTAAGPDFEPQRDLPGVSVFLSRTRSTSRFATRYESDGTRRQVLTARADDVDTSVLPDDWRNPDVLLLAPVAGEVPSQTATAFNAHVVGAAAQGWMRGFDAEGKLYYREWERPGPDLAGVHVLIFSEHDMPQAATRAPAFLEHVPIVALTRGWQGVTLFTRGGMHEVPSLPREEVDPTGSGDVFAASFLLRYHETDDLLESAAFGACAASCAVEGLGMSSLGDRAEVNRRLIRREYMIEEGEWDE